MSTSASNTNRLSLKVVHRSRQFLCDANKMSQLIIQYTAIAVKSFTPHVNITVSRSLSLSHQCQTRPTPLHLMKMSAEARASDTFDLDALNKL